MKYEKENVERKRNLQIVRQNLELMYPEMHGREGVTNLTLFPNLVWG